MSALIHEPTFKQAAGETMFNKARVINTLGNRAVHSHRAIPAEDALAAAGELFHVAYWLARTYGRADRPAPGLAFDVASLPKAVPLPAQTAEQLQQLKNALRDQVDQLIAALEQVRATAAKKGGRLPLDLRLLTVWNSWRACVGKRARNRIRIIRSRACACREACRSGRSIRDARK